MNPSPKLDFLPTQIFGEGVKVDVVDFAAKIKPDSPFKASRIVIDAGQWSPLDNHSVKECWFIVSGTGNLVYADQDELKIKAGDVLYYDSFKSHKVFNNGSAELVIISIWWG